MFGLVLKAASEHTHNAILSEEMKLISDSTLQMSEYFTLVMQVHDKVLFLIYRDQMPSYMLSTASPQLFEVPLILPHLPILFDSHLSQELIRAKIGLRSAETVFQKL